MKLAALNDAVGSHQLWLKSNHEKGEKLNLGRAKLDNAELSRLDLRDADFSEATFTNANFIGSKLSGANFQNANLHQARLVWAILENTNLEGCILIDANLDHVRNLTCGQILEAKISSGTLLPPTFHIDWLTESKWVYPGFATGSTPIGRAA